MMLPSEALRVKWAFTGIARAKNTAVRIKETYKMVGE
jgi:hypothetical protein